MSGSLYTLEAADELVIRRPNGDEVFRLDLDDAVLAEELLFNLNHPDLMEVAA